MPTLVTRLRDDKHERPKLMARAKGVSVNNLIHEPATVALTNFEASVRFETRAARGSPSRALRFLDKPTARVETPRVRTPVRKRN